MFSNTDGEGIASFPPMTRFLVDGKPISMISPLKSPKLSGKSIRSEKDSKGSSGEQGDWVTNAGSVSIVKLSPLNSIL